MFCKVSIANPVEKVNEPLHLPQIFGMICEKTARESGETMYDQNGPIGVFDSGVGGISVLRHLVREMPGERFLYFGDSANAPYGTRPTEEIKALTFRAAEQLLSRGCKALVLACNTATSVAAKELRLALPETIIIGIEPALKPAALRFPGGTVGVIATPATLRDGSKFTRLLAKYEQDCTVVKLPAPGLVELVEQGKAESAETEELLRPLLEPWQGKLDGLVLGCTHYPFAQPVIEKLLPGTMLFDGGEGTARHTRRRLAEAGLLWESGTGEVIFENSCGSREMLALCESLLED